MRLQTVSRRPGFPEDVQQTLWPDDRFPRGGYSGSHSGCQGQCLCETETFLVDESWLLRESPQTQPASHPLSDKLVTHEKEMIEVALTESRGRVS